MGTRSMNYLCLKSEKLLPPDMRHYFDDNAANVIRHPDGPVQLVFETNISPLWSRDSKGILCAHDLEVEHQLQRFLGTLNMVDFYLVRTGDDKGSRGSYVDHPFTGVADVLPSDSQPETVGLHDEGCQFANFSFRLDSPNPNGPDERVTLDESGFFYDSNVTKESDTKNDISIVFRFCPCCGCELT